MSEPIHLLDLNIAIEIEAEAEKTLELPQLLSLLKPSFEKSDFAKIVSILTQRETAIAETLTLKEVERVELQSRCDGLVKRCSELEDQLALKQREVDGYKTEIESLKHEVNDLYVEFVAERMETGDLRDRVSKLEKEKGVIEISDSEDDNVKPSVDSKKDEIHEKDGYFLLIPTPKRKRATRIVCSDSEGDGDDVPIAKLKKVEKLESNSSHFYCSPHRNDQKNEDVVGVEEDDYGDGDDDDDDDDDIPVGKLKERRLANKNVNADDMGHSRKRLVRLGEFGTMKDDKARGASPSPRGRMLSPNPSCMKTRNRSAVPKRLVFSAIEDAKEKKADVVDSDNECDSLDGFLVDESESNSSTDSTEEEEDDDDVEGSSRDPSIEESHSDVDLDDVLSALRRKKHATKWEYEADMLASFAESNELCMRAVCALYRQQTQEEQSVKGTIVVNKRGFNQADAPRASMIAEFLLDGNQHGPPKKSVEEFVKQYPGGLEFCRKIAERYSKQLFTIYQQGEDPFFGPP